MITFAFPQSGQEFRLDLSTHIVFLGTGTPRQDPERSGPCTAIISGGTAYLVDCGPGCVRRAAAVRDRYPALAPRNLEYVFITHLHSDHTLGYPDLIFSPWVVGRNSSLNAFGPKGLANMTDHLEAAYAEDIGIRTEGLEHGNRTGYKVVVKEIDPGIALRRGDLTVTAFPVKHGSWPSAFGYRFKVRDKTIVLSGDTAPCSEIEEQAKGADVLIHEVYAQDELGTEDRAGGGDWPKYLHDFHTSSLELGGIAARAKPKVLVLIHVLRRHATDEALIGEVRKGGFAGQIIVAKDLQSLTP